MNCYHLDHNAVLRLLPERKVTAHKGDFGKLLLICGSRGYTGAAYLAAMGALRVGAGLVYLGVPESIYSIMAGKLVEPIVFPLDDCSGMLASSAYEQIEKHLYKVDAVLIGPGLGISDDTSGIVRNVLQQYQGTVVLDADGINVMKNHIDVLRGRVGTTILTPHEGEFLRLTGDGCEDRTEAAVNAANNLSSIVVLKGHNTVITDGDKIYENLTGNPGMAVGGSGDLLSGIIVGLLGQKLAPIDAAAVGVWLHGAAGDLCADKLGMYGMLPSDMLEVLPRLLK